MRHDPDALYNPPTCVTHEERDAKRREHREMHAAWEARNRQLLDRDARWRRRMQIGLGLVSAVALGFAGTVLYQLMAMADGAEAEWFDKTVASINIGGAATAFTALRMLLAWRKRRGVAGPVARTADTVASIYRP
jgi:hypothetical protein